MAFLDLRETITSGQRDILLSANGMLFSRMQLTIPKYIEAGMTNPSTYEGRR
jgi:hypothetical protein